MKNKQKIGDFLKRIKRPISLDANKEYKLVTIKMKHKGVTLRGLKKGGDIKSKMYQVKQGDFILSGIDARNGAFGIVPAELDGAIVTNDFWYFEIDEQIINKALFLELTSTAWFDDICKRGSDGTTQRVRLQKDKFFNQDIYLPLSDRQQALLTSIQSIKAKQKILHQQAIEQNKQVKQLKQAILQEAIQGKLTADWRVENPDIEPASELLKRIKAEKQKLIDAKKIRKEKPLLPITHEEIPFTLPDGWVWARLGCLARISSGKGFIKSEYSSTGVKLFQIANVALGKTSWDKTVYLPKTYLAKYPELELYADDLVMALNRPLLGRKLKVAQLTNKDVPAILYQRVGRFDFFDDKVLRWLFLYLKTTEFSNWLYNQIKGVNIPFVNQTKLYSHILPLPPLLEQKIIVQKVKFLLQKCASLESEIKQSKIHTEQLMQAVIKEAFEPDKNKEIS